MSWFTLALGLIREAATTEAGQELINDMRPGTARERRSPETGPAQPQAETWALSIERRQEISDRNVEMLVRMVNSQDDVIVRLEKRQRVWNLCLAAALVLVGVLVIWLSMS